MSHLPTDTDIVSLAALHLAAIVGPDHWHRTRPQPIHLTLHLHLTPSYLDTPGQSDNVTDSIHYGHLAKAVENRVGAKGGYPSPRALVDDVTDAAYEFVVGAVGGEGVIRAVRVVLGLPKRILLAGGFEVELTTRASDWSSQSTSTERRGAIVRVTNLVLPVLIGVNPPERLAKQRIVTSLVFFEAPSCAGGSEVDYSTIIERVVAAVEGSAHLTLERLVYGILCTAYRACDVCANGALNSDTDASAGGSRIEAMTVRCQKPSALSFADASGVEMTRTWEALGRVEG